MKQKSIILFFSVLVSTHGFSQDSTVKKTSVGNLDLNISQRAEHDAMFPGGDVAWIKYIQDNVDPDVPVRNKAKKGVYQVIILFRVKLDGTISNINAETNYGYGMEEEAIRVIKNSPKWIPAFQNGRNVSAYRRQPITFKVFKR